MENNWQAQKIRIDKWLKELSEDLSLVIRVWNVFKVIDQEVRLLGQSFRIPIEKFNESNVPLEDRKRVLVALDGKGILGVSRVTTKVGGPMAFAIAKPIREFIGIVEDPETDIHINWQSYRYFQLALRELVDKQADSANNPEQTKQKPNLRQYVKQLLRDYKFSPLRKNLLNTLANGRPVNLSSNPKFRGKDIKSLIRDSKQQFEEHSLIIRSLYKEKKVKGFEGLYQLLLISPS